MLSTGSKIWLAFEAVDMGLSFDGLAGKVAHALGRDPYSGECFVFRSKSGSRLKMLVWDGLGFWLHYRRAYFSDRGRSFQRDRRRRFSVIVDDQRGARVTGSIVS
ncbi:MAG: IS66 family insertion sequence element accessory protein TnpB [Burkholderiales bacterium]|nr:IS66 family insertion sequence element accessory protein TnpB [Burkholderiales bacterium]